MTVTPGQDGRFRARASAYRWRRPKTLYPQFEALCTCWDQLATNEVVLARTTKNEGNMTPWEAMHFRDCFKRIANRYGLYAGLQYNTVLEERELKLVAHREIKPGYPHLKVYDTNASLTILDEPIHR